MHTAWWYIAGAAYTFLAVTAISALYLWVKGKVKL